MPWPPGRGVVPTRFARGDVLAGLRRRHHLAVPTGGQGEPRAHLVRPPDHRRVARLGTQRQRRGTGCLGRPRLTGVVLQAPDQQGQPPGGVQHIPVLGQREPFVQQPRQAVEPLAAGVDQLPGVAGRVVAAQLLDGQAQGVEGVVGDRGLSDPLDQLVGVHPAAHDQHVVGGALPHRTGLGEDRVDDRAERRRDQRAVELVWLVAPALPALPLVEQTLGQRHVREGPQCRDDVSLRPVTRHPLGTQPLGPLGALQLLGHQTRVPTGTPSAWRLRIADN